MYGSFMLWFYQANDRWINNFIEFTCRQAKEWCDTFGYLMTHENKDIQLRAVAMVCNVVKHSKELAEKMLEKEILKVLDVLVKLGNLFLAT